jgi:hypothetical protein
MLLQILQHTPLWVFGVFFGLIFLGYSQTKTRKVSTQRLAILPIVMLCFSVSGVWSTFGSSPLGFIAWLSGISIVLAIFAGLEYPKNIAYSSQEQLYTIPGSWVAFTLIMLIFFTKYTVAVLLIRNSTLHQSTFFIIGICTLYGLSSGWFFARAFFTYYFSKKETIAIQIHI